MSKSEENLELLENTLKNVSLRDKLYNWIVNVIDVNDVPNRIRFMPLHDILNDCIESGKGKIKSTYEYNGEKYTLRIILTKHKKGDNKDD